MKSKRGISRKPSMGTMPVYTHTDLIRFFVIAVLSATIAVVTILALARDSTTIAPQLFYIPILYATYFYQRKGLAVAGVCAIIFELIGSFCAFPDPARSVFVIVQGVLFVAAGAIAAHLSETISTDTKKCDTLKIQIDQDNERQRGVISTAAYELRTPPSP
jgi:uncharacterized oligopeptide transporter (OPT) family protein